MMYSKEKQLCLKGTASAVTNNVAANVSKHQKPPHGFAVIDRQTVHVVGVDDNYTGPSSSAVSPDVPGQPHQYCLDTRTNYVTQVKLYTRAAQRHMHRQDYRGGGLL